MAAVASLCPWNFLGGDEPNAPATVEKRKVFTYADAAQIKVGRDIDIEELPEPDWNGDFPKIRIPKLEHDKGVEKCKLSLVGRLDLNKITLMRVEELTKYWNLKEDLQIIPLGRGFLMFKFASDEDYLRIWGQGSFLWDKQLLRLSKWHPNFSIYRQRQSNALVWIRFLGLSMEYWEPKILMALARAVGRPLHVDDYTAARRNGYYAMVLCDMDLALVPPDRVWVEVEDTDIRFWQRIEIGKTPSFCSHCGIIGHNLADCRALKKDLQEASNKESENKKSNDDVGENQKKHFYNKNQKKRYARKTKQAGNLEKEGTDEESDMEVQEVHNLEGKGNNENDPEGDKEEPNNEGPAEENDEVNNTMQYQNIEANVEKFCSDLDGKGQHKEKDEMEKDVLEEQNLELDKDTSKNDEGKLSLIVRLEGPSVDRGVRLSLWRTHLPHWMMRY